MQNLLLQKPFWSQSGHHSCGNEQQNLATFGCHVNSPPLGCSQNEVDSDSFSIKQQPQISENINKCLIYGIMRDLNMDEQCTNQ